MKGEKKENQTTVDDDVFDSLEEAVTFVAERGGGIVYSLISQSSYAKSSARPNVKIKPMSERPQDD